MIFMSSDCNVECTIVVVTEGRGGRRRKGEEGEGEQLRTEHWHSSMYFKKCVCGSTISTVSQKPPSKLPVLLIHPEKSGEI